MLRHAATNYANYNAPVLILYELVESKATERILYKDVSFSTQSYSIKAYKNKLHQLCYLIRQEPFMFVIQLGLLEIQYLSYFVNNCKLH
jgi:hypothetical protein